MRHYPYKELNTVWLKAAVVGSIWASVEIIVGSFLHNLKIPFTGAILSFVGVFLLVAFSQIWQEKGLVWRAGLICALMKSISPSAVIMGPMIGILSEALFVELFLRAAGRNIVAFMLGGAFAVLTTLVQVAAGFVIIYGFNFIRILAGLYKFSTKQINIPYLNPVYLVLLVVLVYLSAGAFAAYTGYRTGNKLQKTDVKKEAKICIPLKPQNKFFTVPGSQKYSLLLLFGNMAALILCLWFVNIDFSVYSVTVVLTYIAFCFYYYKKTMRFVLKISFWLQFVLITLAAGFFLNGFTKGEYLAFDGIITGLKMNLRAVVIIAGFAAISFELRNPLIKAILYKKGLSNLYQALELSFSALPGVVAVLPLPNELIKKPFASFAGLFERADELFFQFREEIKNRPDVYIISGGIGAGKTTFAADVCRLLKNEGINVNGFLALAQYEDGSNVKTGYNIKNISTGEEYSLCSAHTSGEIKVGQYGFYKDGITAGEKILLPENTREAQVIIVDEIGPLELNNLCWSVPVENLCRCMSIPQIWVVRQKLIEQAIKKWQIGNVFVFDITEDKPEDAAGFIGKEILKFKEITD